MRKLSKYEKETIINYIQGDFIVQSDFSRCRKGNGFNAVVRIILNGDSSLSP